MSYDKDDVDWVGSLKGETGADGDQHVLLNASTHALMRACLCSPWAPELDANEEGVSTIKPEALPVRIFVSRGWIYTGQAKPSGSLSSRSCKLAPRLRMRRSRSIGFLFVSLWPYQYTNGIRALDDHTVGADVAEEPVGFAGEEVDRGVDIAAADIVPGTAQPP